MTDSLQRFIFENSAVRGELVEISDTWKQVLARKNYPAAVRNLLGEMLAAAALLSANLKFNGMIIMQMHGDGPVKLLVIECDSELHLRATAKFLPDVDILDDATLTDLVNVHGNGRFVITLDPRDKLPGQQPYQGIVPLDGDSVSVVIENYMLRSEQLDTKLWLAANEHVSRGLLLQKLPKEGGTGAAVEDDLDTWNHTVTLASTVRSEELLSTDIQTLMHRLFWQETIRVFEPRHPSFKCSCSREKVGNMLRMLGKEEVDSALRDLGSLEIDCDFCGQHYEFDAVDCAQLFAADNADGTQTAGPARH
ncbi:Hsp33 family molecular chaperone HslO [Noviherbaspirillum galbum]|uniref:Hsp33 family molecular chaperone HslO n=1 Tax=Noviherbaspirillum galbum TaxID=2709383 RepID=A0A6B3SGB9_9BURK|nr:Hsp33 family molecular chaperone HslO [Noviherbaspirillum galbum]NEX59927.1 Hsp33 family molecular chaperone HslO [Noviherbaspirillum galbum]